MRKALIVFISVAIPTAWTFSGCATKEAAPPPAATIDPQKLQMFEPLPGIVETSANPVTEDKVALGRMLFYETRLSRSQKLSCNTCHLLEKYGVDGEATSDGHKGRKGDRNSPSVYNAAGHFAQFWDGRAPDVEEQAKGPVTNPAEMAMADEKVVIAVIRSMPEYVTAFKKAFPEDKDPVTFDNMANAIGAFERRLVTPARWDKLLKGDQTALSSDEKQGFNTFVGAGCQACHAGAYVGGSVFQKLGASKAWPDTSDPGREKVTGSQADRLVFKVPSLRNIEKTGPYFHNGRIGTLEQAVASMGEFQLGKTLTDSEVKSIVSWLRSLTGEIPAEYIRPPTLPSSTPQTPKPDLTD